MCNSPSDDDYRNRQKQTFFIDPGRDIELEAECELPPDETALYTEPADADCGGARNTTAWD
ncbi:MAG: hypothetical protein IJT78_03165 [Oscillospiraceae bacterium]|nr:hypothetical protein [Oscillospiraceae bacterium]